MKRLAALLRAVNVGGRKVLMADLRRVASEAGFDNPVTLLASGNLLVSTARDPDDTARVLQSAIAGALGVQTDVLVRDRDALNEVIAGNPFASAASERPAGLAVMFLSGPPAADLEALAEFCADGEVVRRGPGCLYIDYPGGLGSSKLTNAAIERRLKVRGTARNWNTVGKLRGLLD